MRCLLWFRVATLLFLTATVQCQEFQCFSEGQVNTRPLTYNYDGLLTTIEGPIEICVGGQYESVCDIGWDRVDARAACEYLFYGRFEEEPLYGVGEPSRRYASRTYNCSESDYDLRSCNYSSVIDPECNNGSHVAGVRCRQICYDGNVELLNRTYSYDNGLTTTQGRVDICVNGTYLPVCDLGFDNHDAQVVCTSIHGSNYIGEVAQSFSRFPSTEYFAQDLMCNGSESSITQCPYNSLTSPECNVGNHSAAVVCREVCREGNIRLINETYSYNNDMYAVGGTVQVCVNQQYGYVCADNWDNREAEVACRTLSFTYRAPYYENTASTTAAIAGGVPIYRNSMCNGTEYSFSECRLTASDSSSTCASFGTVNCTEVISRCYSEGSFRLRNVTTDISPDETLTLRGRIEVCTNFSYSSLCSQYWDQDDAQVFCEYYARYNYGVDRANITAGYPSSPSQYGYSRAGVVPYDLKCNGTEERVEDCVIDKSPESSSDICKDPASSAAGVVCSIPRPPCPEFDLRLTNSTFDYTESFLSIFGGNIEVCIGGTYVAICDVGWDDEEAQFACNYFGYSEPFYRGEASSGYATTIPIGVENVTCLTNVTAVSQCSGITPPMSPRCLRNSSAAGLRCIQERFLCGTDGDITLLNITYDNYLGFIFGQFGFTGRVAVCQNGVYSSVCDVNWDKEDADVLCRSLSDLGSRYDGTPLYGFESQINPIVLENIDCYGNESDVSSCPRSSLGIIADPMCRESNRAAGVTCRLRPDACLETTPRLVDGPGFYEGRLEICENNQWRTVCEEGFNNAAARSVCSDRLLLSGNATAVYGNAYGPGSPGPMLTVCPVDFTYYATFASIGNCSFSPPNTTLCSHERDVGVRCSKGRVDISATAVGSNRLGSSSFALQCFAFQFPFNTTLDTAGWYDNSGDQISESSIGGRVTIDVLQNMYNPSIVNLTYIFRNQLNFDHPLSISDGGLYTCNISVKLFYPDNNSTVVLTNSTQVPLIVDVPPPSVVFTSADEAFNNRPYNATCVVKFEAAVPLNTVSIRFLTDDFLNLATMGDSRINLSQIRQISNDTFGRDVIVNPLKTEDSGTYICEAGVDSNYATGQFTYEYGYIDVQSPPSPPIGVQGFCSIVAWYSPDVSCDLIHGYDVRLYQPRSQYQNVTRRVSSNGTFYVIKDEDKLAGSVEEAYVQVRVIVSRGVGVWSKGISLGCGEKPTPSVYFELMGKVYLNNSVLSIKEVGEGESALYCRTDKTECCATSPNRFGEFYYPNGVQVPIRRHQQAFYRDRGDKYIRLNRRVESTDTSLIGTYRCEIPNAESDGVMVKIYITIEG